MCESSIFRCTRNAPYINQDVPGATDANARQSYYIRAKSAAEALIQMEAQFSEDVYSFTIEIEGEVETMDFSPIVEFMKDDDNLYCRLRLNNEHFVKIWNNPYTWRDDLEFMPQPRFIALLYAYEGEDEYLLKSLFPIVGDSIENIDLAARKLFD